MLYQTFDLREPGFLSKLGDFYRKDTDIDFFLTYVRAKTDEALNNLMSRFQFSLEER
jgi:hypothetical protein